MCLEVAVLRGDHDAWRKTFVDNADMQVGWANVDVALAEKHCVTGGVVAHKTFELLDLAGVALPVATDDRLATHD